MQVGNNFINSFKYINDFVMRKYIKLLYSLFLIAALFVLNACEEENNYDYAGYKPKVFGLAGPAEFYSVKGLKFTYSVSPRGGSSFTWEVIEGSSIISVAPNENSYKATVTVNAETSVPVVAKVTVFETTSAGVSSEKDTIDIKIGPYVYVNLDDFTGNYTETDGDGQSCPIKISRDPNDEYFGLILEGVLGEDYWFGEPGGKLVIKLYGVDNSVFFAKQKTGILYAPYGDVFLELNNGVKGTFDKTTKIITFDGKVTVAAGSFGNYPFTYTPAAK